MFVDGGNGKKELNVTQVVKHWNQQGYHVPSPKPSFQLNSSWFLSLTNCSQTTKIRKQLEEIVLWFKLFQWPNNKPIYPWFIIYNVKKIIKLETVFLKIISTVARYNSEIHDKKKSLKICFKNIYIWGSPSSLAV